MFLKYPIICSHIYCYSNISLTPRGRNKSYKRIIIDVSPCKHMSPRHLTYVTGNLSYVTRKFANLARYIIDLHYSFNGIGQLCRTRILLVSGYCSPNLLTNCMVI